MRGFWTPGRRKGSDDAQILAAERVHELRQTPYAEMRERAGRDPEVEYVDGPDGGRYERRTSIQRGTRGGAEELRILVQVQRGGRFGRLNPLAEELVIATPDGEMTGEYTLASEGNDPRRYRFG
jgi:hypothetical protein